MPSYNFTRMSDDDVAALYAYLGSAPVSNAAPQGERIPWHQRVLFETVVRFTSRAARMRPCPPISIKSRR